MINISKIVYFSLIVYIIVVIIPNNFDNAVCAKNLHVDISNNVSINETNFSYFNKIQHAIDNASNGDEIYVHIGLYNESIIIDKSIKLIGEDKEKTIINSKKQNISIVLNANEVSIQNLTILNTGIYEKSIGVVVLSNKNIIRNNNFTNFYRGILLNKCNNNLIQNNTLSNSTYGIGLKYSNNNLIYDNNAVNNYITGIFVSDSKNTTVNNNKINLSMFGVALSFCENITIIKNNISFSENDGINIYNSNNTYLIKNILMDNNFGITFYSKNKNISIKDNIISNSNIGVYISQSSTNLLIQDNFFSNVSNKIRVEKKYYNKQNLDWFYLVVLLLVIVNIIIIFIYIKK